MTAHAPAGMDSSIADKTQKKGFWTPLYKEIIYICNSPYTYWKSFKNILSELHINIYVHINNFISREKNEQGWKLRKQI